MPQAEIIATGSELLLGETQDSNTFYLLRGLRSIGVDVHRTMITGDNARRISQSIQEAFSRSDIVIITGGLGPTIDDPTREAAALAFNCPLVYKEELWQEIKAYFAKMKRTPTENNKRQAFIPEIAVKITNPVGTAPAFYIHQNGKLLISFPGVPREMEVLWEEAGIPLIQKFYGLSDFIIVRTLHSFGIGESAVDEIVGKLEKTENPTLGLSAKSGQIDLRITAKGKSKAEAEKMIAEYESDLRSKLGDYIYGADKDTLPGITANRLKTENARLALLEIGSENELAKMIPSEFIQEIIPPEKEDESLSMDQLLNKYVQKGLILVILRITKQNEEFHQIEAAAKNGEKIIQEKRSINQRSFDPRHPVFYGLNTLRMCLTDTRTELPNSGETCRKQI